MSQSIDGKMRQHLLNAMLLWGSIACTYLIVELVFFRILLPQLSLNLKTYLPDTAGVLVQASKAELVPHNYIALLGDSNAEGMGDWLLQGNGDRTKPFHSANVIREATGRDVVSFGHAGIGSAEALVERPALIFGGTECYLFPQIEAPRDLIIYFYEGNDIEDNVRFLGNVVKRYGDISDASIDRFLVDHYAAPHSWWKCRSYLAETAVRMVRFQFLNHLHDGYRNLDFNSPRENIVMVAGEPVPAPRIQGPGLLFEQDQTIAAMRVFNRSLRWLKDRFPGIPTTVVYLPSQASIYRFATDEVATGPTRGQRLNASPPQIAQRSDFMCDLAREAALSHGVAFLDARPTLRRAAETSVIHGPLDWVHFNEAGYRILGELVVQQVMARR